MTRTIAPDTTEGALDLVLRRRDALLGAGVAFPTVPAGTLPWLCAVEPFRMDDVLAGRVAALGSAVAGFVDHVQRLYADRHPVVTEHLDLGTAPDLCGLDVHRPLQTFRLDMIVEDGWPVVTELEEVYGNAGKAHAMEVAYGVRHVALFRHFDRIGITHVLVDDQVRTYGPELELFRRAMRERHGRDVAVAFLGDVDVRRVRSAWRFCYVTDFRQYSPQRRRTLTVSGIDFVNPLFHGFGQKSLLALAWHPALEDDLVETLGPETFAVLRAGLAETHLVTTAAQLERLHRDRKRSVVKVVDSADRSMTWGSRGVFFGDSSARRWAEVLAAVERGHLPGRTTCPAVYAATRLVESDRFDVLHLDAAGEAVDVMRRARIRLAPIFFREAAAVEMVAGHATFVHTSRKVHLGRHAVCAPLDWVGDGRR